MIGKARQQLLHQPVDRLSFTKCVGHLTDGRMCGTPLDWEWEEASMYGAECGRCGTGYIARPAGYLVEVTDWGDGTMDKE